MRCQWSLSECCTFKCGIRQGIILGPLLFLLYINDLPNCLSHSVPRMYADDTHLTYSNGNIHSVQSSLNEDLSTVEYSNTFKNAIFKWFLTIFSLGAPVSEAVNF